MSQKLWVAHETAAKRFIDKVSIEGCEDVADFLKEVKKESQLAIPQNAPITLYKSDATSEIKVGASPADYLEGNTDENPLIVCSTLFEKGISIYKVLISEVPKGREIDKLIAKSKQYLFRTLNWGCVAVIEKRRAVTFAHGEHQTLTLGSTTKIYSVEGEMSYDVKVLDMRAKNDWVMLESCIDLCQVEPTWGVIADGRGYIQLGLSAKTQQESPFSISKGVISTSRLNKLGHLLGSAGANPCDSGGPCFDESTSELIGINVGCENIPITIDKDTLSMVYSKISSRYASRAHIIPISTFQFQKSDLEVKD
jgi:hypothetical protein